MEYIGVDISKSYFDADLGLKKTRRFPNDASGFKKFLALADHSRMCVVEATGPYSWSFVFAVHEAGLAVAMENPLKVRRFIQSMFQRAKTDTIDAKMLTLYGESIKPKAFEPPAPYILRLRQLLATYTQLVEQRTALLNQTEAFTHMPVCDPAVKRILRKTIASLDRTIEEITNAMDAIIAEHCKPLFKHLCSIPGVGEKSARVMIALAGDWSRFETAKAFAAYTGLTPRIYESGSSVKGRSGIVKLGDPLFRKTLYMCSLSAIRHNPGCHALYIRLRAKGKNKMTALVAAMHKLARQIWAVATHQQNFNKDRAVGVQLKKAV
jgi:transposase